MNKPALSRLLLLTMASLAILLPVRAKGGEEDDPRLVKIFADWRKRRESVRGIQCSVQGERVFPRGSFVDDFGVPVKPESPPRDVILPMSWSLHLDFPTNRHRLEVEERDYDRRTGSSKRKVWINFFDGSALQWREPQEAADKGAGGAALQKPDGGVYTGNLKGAAFQQRFWPVFLASGVVMLPGELIYPGQLTPPMDSSACSVHGQAVREGRPCTVVRGFNKSAEIAYQEYWVDVDRDSSVVRFLIGSKGRPAWDMDVQYEKSKSGWLPKSWTITVFEEKSRVNQLERFRVKRIEVNQPMNETEFQFPVQPGILLRKTDMGEVDNGIPVPVIKDSHFYRADENGDLTEVVIDNGTERRKISAWWLISLVIASAVVVLGVVLRRRMRPTRPT